MGVGDWGWGAEERSDWVYKPVCLLNFKCEGQLLTRHEIFVFFVSARIDI